MSFTTVTLLILDVVKDETEREEVEDRSKQYISEFVWTDLKIHYRMDNDWDVYELVVDLKGDGEGNYVGILSAFWDDVHTYNLICKL